MRNAIRRIRFTACFRNPRRHCDVCVTCCIHCTRLYYVHALATTDGYTTVAILQHARVSASIGLYAELVGVATLQSLPSLNSDFHMRMNNE